MTAAWSSLRRRWPLYLVGLLAALLAWSTLDASGGVADPTASPGQLSHGAVVFDSGLLVFREGLETILVLAAVTASMAGANTVYRRPTSAGAVGGFAATLVTWFVAVWAIGRLGGGGLALQAATGLLAVIVLLVVMNWFFHRVYWTGWIANHHRRRRRILDRAGIDSKRATMLGLILLGFTSVYREGFEVVLFLQNLRLSYGAAAVLEGAALGLALTAVVGLLTFLAHRHLNYKRMLVVTGVLLGVVLIVMVGESVQEMQLAGWLPATAIPLSIPGWVGLWFAVFPTAEGLAAQLLAAALVIGSYYGAEYVKVRRPRASGANAARRPEAAPRWEPVQRPSISVETIAS